MDFTYPSNKHTVQRHVVVSAMHAVVTNTCPTQKMYSMLKGPPSRGFQIGLLRISVNLLILSCVDWRSIGWTAWALMSLVAHTRPKSKGPQ